MSKIQVEESALDSISAMAKKLQEERDELLEFAKQVESRFNWAEHEYSLEWITANDAKHIIAKCTSEPAMWESTR